ncbi:hypothetical protein PN451_12890 [Dolichospermum planctonicum CS-1226]|uniref:Uncharacterized protein n=1 Tax=Dolichospermum planctonicum CS-1226 TaxID=3021751 RepID=A0ABT5AHG8_9CYAN|nr:hypothetical protein [Dolichospermum planctonicum]MDB9536710.1 hypothetical protein [Dolichospermum planctonicum CS-1226]
MTEIAEFMNGKTGAIQIATAAANYYNSQYAEADEVDSATRNLAVGASGIVSGALGLAGGIWGAVNATKHAESTKKLAVSIRNMTMYPIIFVEASNINKNDAINPIIQPTETANWPLRTGAIDNTHAPQFQARIYTSADTCAYFALAFNDNTGSKQTVNLSGASFGSESVDRKYYANPDLKQGADKYNCPIIKVNVPFTYFVMVSGVGNSSDAKVNISIVSDHGLV